MSTFSLGAVLTITTGKLLCSLDELYAINSFMAGESVMTHQLPRVAEEASPVILDRYPELAHVDVPVFTGEPEPRVAVETWLTGLIEAGLPAAYELQPLDAADHTSIDPIAELKMMRPDADVMVVEIIPTDRDGL